MSPGAFTLSVQTLGRLTAPEQFENIVVRAEPDGAVIRRARHRARRARLAGLHASTPISTTRRRPPSSSSSGRARTRWRRPTPIKAEMDELAQGLPARRRLFASSTTRPSSSGTRSTPWSQTLFEALVLVVARGDPVPADLARGDHPDPRHPGLADRHLRGDGGGRHLVQHAVAVRPGAGHRHRRRRRHRRGRERRALSARRACRPRRRRTRPWTRSAAR